MRSRQLLGRFISIAMPAAISLPWTPAVAVAQGIAAMSDFSKVTSVAAARALVDKGRLVRVLLYPAELGGEDRPENVVYVPPEAAEAQRLIIGTLVRFTREGLIDRMTVEPRYKGDSIVPSVIAYRTSQVRKRGGFSPTIEIW